MMEFNGYMLGVRVDCFRVGQGEAALIISIDFGCECTGKDATAMNIHVIDEAVGGQFLD